MSTAAAALPAEAFEAPSGAETPQGAAKSQTLSDLMTPPVGVFGPSATVKEAVEALREQVKNAFITYLYVVDQSNHLLGLVVMREMLLAEPDTTLESLMLTHVDPLIVDTTGSHWHRLATSADLLSLWSIFLAALGWRVFTRASWTQAIVVAVLPYLVVYGVMAVLPG